MGHEAQRPRRESWLLLILGSALLLAAIFLAVTRESVSEPLIVTLLTFSAVFLGVPLPDILRPRASSGDKSKEEPKP